MRKFNVMKCRRLFSLHVVTCLCCLSAPPPPKRPRTAAPASLADSELDGNFYMSIWCAVLQLGARSILQNRFAMCYHSPPRFELPVQDTLRKLFCVNLERGLRGHRSPNCRGYHHSSYMSSHHSSSFISSVISSFIIHHTKANRGNSAEVVQCQC